MTTGKFCNVIDPYSDTKSTPKHLNYDIKSEYVFDTNMLSEQEKDYGPIDEWKHKWTPADGKVTWAVVSKSDDPSIKNWEERAVAIALRTWGLRTKNIKFRKLSINLDPYEADLVVKWDSPDTNQYLKDRPSTLAYAYFPGQGKISGDVTMNDKYIWTKDGKPISAHIADPTNYPDPYTNIKFKTYNVVQVLCHEFGHSLGLRHNTECHDCMMYPYYNGYVTLHSNDIKRIQSFYGARKLSGWILEYFRKRMIRKFNGKRVLGEVK